MWQKSKNDIAFIVTKAFIVMGIRFYIEEIMSMEQDHYPLQQQKLKVYVIKKVREMETETEM